MKWKGEKYQQIKHVIFDLMRMKLDKEDSARVTVKQLSDAIDEMIEKVTRIADESRK